MKKLGLYLRNSCLKNETVGNLAMLAGTGLFAGTLGFFIFYQQEILTWVHANPLVNPIILGALILLEVFLVYALSRMVFTDCRAEEAKHGKAYIGRRSTLFPEATSWVDHLGKNPKRL